MLMVGASAFFPYVVSKGLAFAPASDGGALAPGMLPFWATVAAYALAGEVPGPRRRAGLAMICWGRCSSVFGPSSKVAAMALGAGI